MNKRPLHRLLAGKNQLSRLDKEEIFENVLREVAPRRAPRTRTLGILVASAVALAAIVALTLPLGRREPDGRFAPRGGLAQASFELACPSSPRGECRRGDRLLFYLDGHEGYRYFAAFARSADGRVVWYFPSAPKGGGVELAHALRERTLDRAIVLGPEHAQGRHDVYGIFSARPLDRQAIRDRFDAQRLAAGEGTRVVVRALEVR